MQRFLALSSLLVITGCATPVPPATIATPERLKPIQSTANDSQSIYVANVGVKIVERKIGQAKFGLLCLGENDLIWRENLAIINSMREQMSATLSKNGYKVSTGLIQVNNEQNSDILIGAAVEDIRANICHSVEGAKGAASLTLRWEILNNKTKISTILTGVGSANLEQFSKTGDPDLFMRAVEMAAENIMAQDAFFRATRR